MGGILRPPQCVTCDGRRQKRQKCNGTTAKNNVIQPFKGCITHGKNSGQDGKNGKKDGKNGKKNGKKIAVSHIHDKNFKNYLTNTRRNDIIKLHLERSVKNSMKQVGRTPIPLTPEQRAIAIEYLDTEISYKELSAKYGKAESTIIHWVKKLRKEREGDKP